VSRPRYRARRVRAQGGALIGWGVFLPVDRATPMAAAFTGRFAGWRARRYASALNRKGRQ
jgi:hypothetical protein